MTPTIPSMNSRTALTGEYIQESIKLVLVGCSFVGGSACAVMGALMKVRQKQKLKRKTKSISFLLKNLSIGCDCF